MGPPGAPGAPGGPANKKQGHAPQAKMKGYQWTKLNFQKIKGTVFEKFPEGKVKFQ
jgi:hypothetical protein